MELNGPFPYLPFTNMEHSRSLRHDHLELLLETVVGDVLQGPVPVVVVELKGDGGNYLIKHLQSHCPDIQLYMLAPNWTRIMIHSLCTRESRSGLFVFE